MAVSAIVQPAHAAQGRSLILNGQTSRVIQPQWVFIGGAEKRVNMKDNKDGTYTYSGNKYIGTGKTRDGSLVVALESHGDDGQNVDMVDDELSEYSEYSIDSEDEFAKLGGKSKGVLAQYQYHKHDDFGQINTSQGLFEIVTTLDTAKQSAANTHVLVRGQDDDKYTMYQLGTANAVKLYATRFSFDVSPVNVQGKWKKKAGVHTEMHILHSLTDGNKNAIKGCLKGYTVVVDKEVCADCYPYMVLAGPDEVRDGTDFTNQHYARQRWSTWTDPFSIK